MENRNGLIVSSRVWEATGMAERYAALEMLQDIPGSRRVTVGGDKGFDAADFVRECRNIWVTPHVAHDDVKACLTCFWWVVLAGDKLNSRDPEVIRGCGRIASVASC